MYRSCVRQSEHCDFWKCVCPRLYCANSITTFTRQQAVICLILCLLGLRSCQNASQTNSEQHYWPRKCDEACTRDTNSSVPLDVWDFAFCKGNETLRGKGRQSSAARCSVFKPNSQSCPFKKPNSQNDFLWARAQTVKYRQVQSWQIPHTARRITARSTAKQRSCRALWASGLQTSPVLTLPQLIMDADGLCLVVPIIILNTHQMWVCFLIEASSPC